MAERYKLEDFCKESCFAYPEIQKGNEAAKRYCENACNAYLYQKFIDERGARIVSFEMKE